MYLEVFPMEWFAQKESNWDDIDFVSKFLFADVNNHILIVKTFQVTHDTYFARQQTKLIENLFGFWKIQNKHENVRSLTSHEWICLNY